MLKIQFDIKQLPWCRPNYSSVSEKLLVPSLKADFEDVILNEFKVAVYTKGLNNRFPLNEAVSILIEISSDNDLNILLAGKNIIDSLNNHAFTDDVNITNLYISIKKSNEDRMHISLLRPLNITDSINVDELKASALITFTVKTKLIDSIISIPINPTIHVLNNPSNIVHVNKLRSIINLNPDTYLNLSNVSLTFDICTSAIESDLDNICLNYLLAIKGLIINDFTQIKMLCANIHHSSKDYATLYVTQL